MLFVIHAFDIENGRDLRRAHTEAHVEYLKSQPSKVHLAGPLLEEGGEAPIGSMLVIEAPDAERAREFSRNDPYTQAGLFAEVHVTAWRKTVGWTD